MIINSTSFGKITIDNKTYDYDVWIFADRTIKRRTRDHEFTLDEFNTLIIIGEPKAVVIGTGQSGCVNVTEKVIQEAKKRNIELHIKETSKAIKIFNEINKQKSTAAAIHVTC